MSEYWVEGDFIEFWSDKSYYSHEQDLFIPKFAIIGIEYMRIYLDKPFVEMLQKKKELGFDMKKKTDQYSLALLNAINKPHKKSTYVGPANVGLP